MTCRPRVTLGLIAPPTNTVNEVEWNEMLRGVEGVGLQVTRMALHTDVSSAEGRSALYADLAQAVRDLAAYKPDVIAYGCTAGSMVSPLDSLTDLMRTFGGVACAATASSLVYAARALGLRRVVVATPYHEALTTHELHYLASHGLEVLHIAGLGIGGGGPHEYVRIARLAPEAIRAHCLATWREGADGMIVSCTALPTLRRLPQLEAAFGRPVVSSNLATLWRSWLMPAGADAPPAGSNMP